MAKGIHLVSALNNGDWLPKHWDTARALLWFRWLLIALLVLWLCHSLARLFWVASPEPDLLPLQPSVAQPFTSVASDNSLSAVDIQALKALKLFGEPPKVEIKTEVEEVAPPPEVAVETRLNLELQGVLASNEQEKAHAIIAQGSKQSLYRVGDEIAGERGVKLSKVLADRVILDNNGRFESLLLYPEGVALSSSSRSPSRTVDDDDDDDRDRAASRPIPSAAKVSRSLSEVIKVSMAREGGDVIGFRVRPGRNRQAFEELGLKTNDIVTSVNGVALTSSAKAMEVYRSMNNATQASLDIKRQGEELTIEVDVADLAEQ